MKCILCNQPSGEYPHCNECYDKNLGSRDYQDMVKKNTPKKIRQKMNIGNIRSNQIQCLQCGDKPRSKNRHNYQYCKCGAVAVDGGSRYTRIVMKNATDKDFKFLTVMFDDIESLLKKHE